MPLIRPTFFVPDSLDPENTIESNYGSVHISGQPKTYDEQAVLAGASAYGMGGKLTLTAVSQVITNNDAPQPFFQAGRLSLGSIRQKIIWSSLNPSFPFHAGMIIRLQNVDASVPLNPTFLAGLYIEDPTPRIQSANFAPTKIRSILADGAIEGSQIISSGAAMSHGAANLPISANGFQRLAPATAGGPALNVQYWGSGVGANDSVTAALQLLAGEVVDSIDFNVNQDLGAVITATLWETNMSSQVSLGSISSALAGGDVTITIPTINTTIRADRGYVIEVAIPLTGGAGGLRVYLATVNYHRP